jgi:hypothetical protein
MRFFLFFFSFVHQFKESENQGTSIAGKFSIGVHASMEPDSLEVPVPFVVSNTQSDVWMPDSNSSILPGESIVIEGELFFHPSLKGKTIQVFAVADACSEGNACVINEINESNNQSNPLLLDLSIPLVTRFTSQMTLRKKTNTINILSK